MPGKPRSWESTCEKLASDEIAKPFKKILLQMIWSRIFFKEPNLPNLAMLLDRVNRFYVREKLFNGSGNPTMQRHWGQIATMAGTSQAYL